MGRPPKYKNAEEMQVLIDKYFADCDIKEKPYTICGLALALDLDRQSLLNYSDKDKEFFDTIKKAKQKCEAYAEERLYGNNVTGVIFNLKNNYGWIDERKEKVDGELTVKWEE